MWHDQVEALKSDLGRAQKKVSKYKTWHKVATNHFTGVPGKEHRIGQALEKVSAWQETVDDLLLEIKQLQEVRTRCELAANSLYPTNNSPSAAHCCSLPATGSRPPKPSPYKWLTVTR